MTTEDAYRTLGIPRGAAQADAFAAYQEESSRLAAAPEEDVVRLNRAYEVVTQDIWRRVPPTVDAGVSDDDEEEGTPGPPEPWEAVGRRPPSRWRVGLLVLGLVVAALATLLVVAPMTGGEDEDDGWSDEFEANVLEGCAYGSGGLDDACRCMVDELSATMSEEAFVRLNYEIAADWEVPDELVSLATDCFSNRRG